MGTPVVLAVHRSSAHSYSKASVPRIELVAGHGVRDDTHFGVTVQHRSRMANDPTQPNLRQVHFLHAELLDELGARGFPIEAGQMGENITTRGLDLLGLSVGSLIRIGATVVVRVTGLRNPCGQIETFRPGLLAAVLYRAADGAIIRRAGVMGVVEEGGWVQPGDPMVVSPPASYVAMQVV
jgi:MOSC domain-containing protein YiiM